MMPSQTPYSSRVRQSSSQLHQFINKLRYKENESVHFLLVHDSDRNKRSNTSSSNHSNHKRAIRLYKPLKRLETRIPQIKLYAKNNNPIHLLSQNANGYAVFMGINVGGTKDSEIEEIRAQFIDVDLNKISGRFTTIEPNKRIQKLKKEFLRKNWSRIRDAMIVETYNGYHIYWPIVGGTIGKFVPIQKALVRTFNSDPAITNLARVMRIPGFYHMKNPDRPFLVRVIRWGRKRPFSQDELIDALSLRP
ncbi:hypothetical protein [Paenibacillus prosopidis]|uniref:Uncharacterized protein n=1 Tax=Paenibacillus prosopidis TaxID=630520 RepID=A0A368W3I6_9BACL|nr:hypothetical protein [Paenibacillus prosopidis]RCW47977.1 hypothetical protein DFP97_107179 [Paenibacillus prosopidis]